MVVVVSPLISLMHDQVSKLVGKGVKAVSICGDKSNNAFVDVIEGRVTYVFGSPEAFIGNRMWRSLSSLMIASLDTWWPWRSMKLTAL